MKVVDNVQIFLDNIHVRYEDDVSNPDSPFAFGFTLDSLHAQSCDGNWQAAFLTVGGDVIHKLLTLQNLSIYLNTTKGANAQFVSCESAEAMSSALKELIPSFEGDVIRDPDHYYILKPVSGLLKATLDRGDLVLSRPRLQLDAELQKIGLALTSSQFQRAQDVLEHFSLYVRSLEYMDIRPPVDVRPTKDPKLWWKFVLTAVRRDVRKRYATWSWDYIKQRSRDRETYMTLHEKRLNVSLAKMSSEEQKKIEALELNLDYNDIITFRQLAAASWQIKQQAAAEKKKQQGWFGGWFGGGSKSADKDEAEKDAEQEAAMKELYAAIGYNAEQVEKETVFPKDYVKNAVNFKIQSCRLELRQDDILDEAKLSPSSSAASSPQSSSSDVTLSKQSRNPTIISFDQHGFMVSLLMREGSMSVVSTLDTIKMADYHTLAGKELVMLEPDYPALDDSKKQILAAQKLDEGDVAADLVLQQKKAQGVIPTFMAVTFDMNPLDAPDIDIRVGLKMQPVQSTLSRALIDRIVQFFERKTTRVQLVEISSAAASTWEDLRNRAQTNLKYTIEKRMKLKLDLELAAPRFTIPKNFTDPTCPAIILDLGTIVFKSDPDARSKGVAGPTSDATVSEDYFYDRFDLSMKNLHAMVVGGKEAPWAKSKSIDPAKYVVINKFDVDVILKVCGAPSPDLPQLKIAGNLRRLALDITDYRITWMLDVFEALGKSTIPPKQLTPEEKAAMRLILLEMKKQEASKSKLQLLSPSSERSGDDSSSERTPSMKIRRKKHVADISDAPSTPDDSTHLSPPSPAEDSASSSSSPAQKPSPKSTAAAAEMALALNPNLLKKQLEINFSLGELTVTLHKTVPLAADEKLPEGELASAPPSAPLTTLGLKDLSVKFSQTNHWMTVGLRLGAFVMEDKFTPGAPNLIESGTVLSDSSMPDAADLVELRYKNVPTHSAAFENVEHDIKAKFGTLKINVNRVTIACLMQVCNDFVNTMSANKKVDEQAQQQAADADKDENEAVEEVSTKSTIGNRSGISLAKLDINLGELIVCLQKENVAFLNFQVARSQVNVDVRGDSVLHVSGYLGGVSLSHPKSDKMQWSNLISTSSASGDKILHFQFSKYNRESPTYPGCDMSVMASMSSLKAVVVASSLYELGTYFSAFDKMRKAIELTTAYYYNASIDAVRTAADAATKIKLDFTLNNPTIIVPQSSTDTRHVLLDLGKITLRNNWETLQNGVELDVMEASITGLNMHALTNPKASESVRKLYVIDDSSVGATLKRPLSGNEKFLQPGLDLTANIESIDINFTEEHLNLVFGILGENLSEKPARPDSVELSKIVEFLSSFSYTMESWEVAKKDIQSKIRAQVAQAKPVAEDAHVNLVVHAFLKQVSLTLHKGSGENEDTGKPTSLATFAIQQLSADYKAHSDSRMDIDITLGNVVLEDKRVYSENKFRRIWAPNVEQGARVLGGRRPGGLGKRVPAVPISAATGNSAAGSPALSDSSSPVPPPHQRPQFSLTYHAEPAQLFTLIKMELYRPRLYLIPSAIQELYEFAMDQVDVMVKSLARLKEAQAAQQKAENSPRPGTLSSKNSSSSLIAAVTRPTTTAVSPKPLVAETGDVEDVPVSTMRIEVLLTSPELCVVENTDKVDPIAIVLHLGESKLRLFTTSDSQMKLDLGVQKLDAYKCILDADRSDLAHDIVKLTQPLSLGVNMSTTTADKVRRMAVEVGALQTIVSYNDIKLFLDVYASYQPLLASFSKPRGASAAELTKAASEIVSEFTSADAALDSVEVGAAIAADLDLNKESKAIQKEQKQVEKDAKKAEKDAKKSKKSKKGDEDEEEEEEELVVIDRTVQTQLMIITVDRIALSVLNDRESPDYTTPVAEQSLESVKVMFSMYESGCMDALVTLSTLELKAYNNRLAAFEPVIEPWSAEVNFLKSPTGMGLHLVSQEMMDVNITKSLLDTTFGLLKLLDDFKSPDGGDGDSESSSQSGSAVSSGGGGMSKKPLSKQKKKKKKRKSFNPYVVANETSHPISIRLSHNPTSTLNVPAGAEMPIQLQIDREQAAQRIIRPEMDIAFPTRADLNGIGHIPVARIATYTYSLSEFDASLVLVVDITFDQGSKIITVRSNRIINNDTDFDMEVGWVGPTAKDWSKDILLCPANDHLSLPIELCSYRALRFRPAGQGKTLKWFEWGRGEDELAKSRELMRRMQKKGHMRGDATRSALVLCIDDAKDSTWVCRAKEVERSVEGLEHSHDYVMTLSPALTIENATCAEIEVTVVNPTKKSSNADEEFPFPAVPPQILTRATHIECYVFEGWTQLQSGLGRLAISTKLPGFSWSTPARFAEHAHWVPVRGNPNKLREPVKLVLGDETDARPLTLLADVRVDDVETCHITIYSDYWLINQSGLNLWYRDGDGAKSDREAAGQRVHPPESPEHESVLSGDPAAWYDPLNADLEPPMDFKYANNRLFFGGSKLSVKVEDSAWSKPFPLGMQNEGMITIKDKAQSGRQYGFGVRVKPAPGRFWRTKLVRILPAFILVNKCQRVLRYRQEGQQGRGFLLNPNQQLPFHWPVIAASSAAATSNSASDGPKSRLSLSTEDNPELWSPSFALDIASSFQVRLRNEFSDVSEESTLDVIIKPMEGTTFIIIGEQTGDAESNKVTVVSYELQNKTRHALSVKQKDSDFTMELPANSTRPFCWDVPQVLEPRILLRLPNDPPRHPPADLSLDIIARFPEIPFYVAADGTRLKIEVQAQGPKKVLIVDDATAPTLAPARNLASSSVSLEGDDSDLLGFEVEKKRVVNMHFKVSLKGIGVSVIDATPQELLYFTLQTLFADYQVSNLDQRAEVKIGMAQLDNQLYLSPLPIALYSTPNPEKAFFHATMVRDTDVKAVQFFRYLGLQMQEIDLAIHEVFLYRLLSFTKFLTDYLYAKSEEEALQKLLLQTDSDIPKLKDEDLAASDMYYFELFHLNPIKVLITFMTSMDLDANMEQGSGDDDSGGGNDATSGLAEILGYVGVLTDIERAPIELNALMLHNPFCSRNDLMDRITKHYTLAGLRQAYKIVGSADFLGNPVSLVSNLGTGVKDFFYEPAMGIVESPAAFGRGLAKGTSSLLLKTTYAIFDTASKLTGTVAKVGAKLTLDDDYQRERAVRNQTKARHAGEGILYGARDFGLGIYKGITGVVLEPIKGGQEEGAVGVFKGIGKGLAGIVLKPVVGAVDLVTRTTEGIKNTTTYMDEKSKAPIRPPRYFGADGLTRIFDYEKAAGQLVLRTLTERRGRRDIYESHVLLKEKLVILSRRHIFVLNQDGLNFGSKWKIEWMHRLSSIVAAIAVVPVQSLGEKPSSSDEKSFTGVVFDVEPINDEPRRHAIRTNEKQAGALAKRLISLNVGVKRASTIQEVTRPPTKMISGAPITATNPVALDRSVGDHRRLDSSQDQKNIQASNSQQSLTRSADTELEDPTDTFQIKINPKASKYGALPDWIDEETDDEMDNFGSRSAKSKRKRKARADETTRLLGDDPEDSGCCSCCTVM